MSSYDIQLSQDGGPITFEGKAVGSGGGGLPANWTENAATGLNIDAPADLSAAGALVVTLAPGTDPADENSVIQIIGRDGTNQVVSYFDVDQGGGFYLQFLDGTAQMYIRPTADQSVPIFRIDNPAGGQGDFFKINADGTAQIILPTADPHVAGALWNDAGTPTISAG